MLALGQPFNDTCSLGPFLSYKEKCRVLGYGAYFL